MVRGAASTPPLPLLPLPSRDHFLFRSPRRQRSEHKKGLSSLPPPLLPSLPDNNTTTAHACLCPLCVCAFVLWVDVGIEEASEFGSGYKKKRERRVLEEGGRRLQMIPTLHPDGLGKLFGCKTTSSSSSSSSSSSRGVPLLPPTIFSPSLALRERDIKLRKRKL